MATEQSAITKFALNDILNGLASGLNDAQKQLRSMAPYDEFGRPNVMYQLPYLDFQLQVNSEFESTSATGTAGNNGIPVGATLGAKLATPRVVEEPTPGLLPVKFGAPKASFKFSTVKNGDTKGNVEVKSTISGRFIAIAPNEGLPQIVLSIAQEAPVSASVDLYKINLNANLSNTGGEKIRNSLIEFNFDKELSDSINPNVSYSNPTFSASEVRTNETGIASTCVLVKKSDYDSGVRFILTIGFGTMIKSISICKN
jgi:hypothetical protein